MIDVRNLSKSYGKVHILREVSLTANRGEITILTGDNGTGKTTLLRILAGIARPDSGIAEINGTDIIRNRKAAQQNLSFLPQKLAFHPAMTPRSLLHFYSRLRKRKISADRMNDLLRDFDLLDHRNKQVRHLSGGMLQRLGLALLLLPDAPILLLDEPAISLDPGWRRRLADLLRNEAKQGKTVLLTTHLPEEWVGGAEKHLVCRDQMVLETDSPLVSTA